MEEVAALMSFMVVNELSSGLDIWLDKINNLKISLCEEFVICIVLDFFFLFQYFIDSTINHGNNLQIHQC